MAALILVFLSGMAIYLYLARRKRLLNNPRDEWEFEPLQGGEGDSGRALVGGRKRGGRRAGELYDAFAAGSDDELDSDGEYMDEGGEAEKKLYDSDGETEHHVIGEESDEEEDEKTQMHRK